jgi:hypothetical protein
MGELMQEIFLGDFMVFFVMGIALLLVTSWAFRLREFAGYALGWLVGIFIIIFLSLLTWSSEPNTAATTLDGDAPLRVNFFLAMIASAFGLAIGFGILELVKFGGRSESRAARALLIASLVTINLVSWYLLLMAARDTRLVIALFVLAFAIGMLFNFIISRRYSGYTAQYPPVDYPPMNADAQSSPYGNLDTPTTHIDVPMDVPGPIAQRLENVRNIAQRRRR